MNDLSSKTVLVADHGLFLPIAFRMAESFQRVLYWTPWERGFPRVHDCLIGDGFDNVERCDDLWKVKDEVDLFVFPDIHHSGIQLELKRQGKAVWGSGEADSLEINRRKFLKVLHDLGLNVPQFETVRGLTNLRLYLKDKEDKYIKISKYRGSFETTHWRSWKEDHCNLDAWGVEFGACQDLINFLVFDPIGDDIEIGCDLYCVDGKYPSVVLRGDEYKDKSYLAAVTDRKDLPDPILEALDAFAETFKGYQYRNQLSLELRGEGNDWYFIDPTCRGGLPSTASQLATWNNFPEIVWAGAHGELVEPEPNHQFSAEAVLCASGEKNGWHKCVVPDELIGHAFLGRCCMIDGAYCFPPDETHDEEIGWLQAGGETLAHAITKLKLLAELLPQGVTAKTETLANLLKEIHEADEEGVAITEKEIPDPSIAIE